jgi:hypothetical protein
MPPVFALNYKVYATYEIPGYGRISMVHPNSPEPSSAVPDRSES